MHRLLFWYWHSPHGALVAIGGAWAIGIVAGVVFYAYLPVIPVAIMVGGMVSIVLCLAVIVFNMAGPYS